MKGLFQLRGSRDLLAKLRHDFERLSKAPADAYIAFDFFVTAEHMLDWIYPGAAGRGCRTNERNAEVVLQVVSHLANGAKHMILEDTRHTSVQHTDVAGAAYGEGVYGADSYGGCSLVIRLDGVAADVLGTAVTPLDLARRVVEYWECHAALQ